MVTSDQGAAEWRVSCGNRRARGGYLDRGWSAGVECQHTVVAGGASGHYSGGTAAEFDCLRNSMTSTLQHAR